MISVVFNFRNGFTDVVHYLLKSGRISADFVDNRQRSLVFLAVIHRQPKVLQFLLSHVGAFVNVSHLPNCLSCCSGI